MAGFLSAVRNKLGLRCPKCDGIILSVLAEERQLRLCDLGMLVFNPICSMCCFFRSVCQDITGLSEDGRLETQSWMEQTHLKLWANTTGRSATPNGDIGCFQIIYSDPEHAPGDDRKPTIHVRIRRAQDEIEPSSWSPGRRTCLDPTPAIKEWLANCTTHDHNSDVSQQNTRNSKVRHASGYIHLVDCEYLCVVKIAFDSDLNYAALSYVWGMSDQFTLCTDNYAELLKIGSLAIEQKTLPRSIRDAMNLCPALDIRYLWVDSLCIIQDNQHDKYIHINSMESIYRQALLTIVSAAGKDANAGLPAWRYRDMSLNHSLSIRGLFLYEWKNSWSTLDLSKPKWLTRGWTYQEAALSTRMLIFTEDTFHGVCSKAQLFYDPLSNKLLNCDCLDTSLSPSPVELQATQANLQDMNLAAFVNALDNFVKRQLTKDEDNINAFTGILKTMEPSMGSFWYGLPLSAFVSCLHHTHFADQPVRVPEFPSWSWAGWRLNKTGISISVVKSFVSVYGYNAAGILESVHEQRTAGIKIEKSKTFPMHEPSSAELAQLKGFEEPGVPRDRLIVFWAWEVQLYVCRVGERSSVFEIRESLNPAAQERTMEIRLESKWAERSLPEKHSFIVFAITRPHDLVHPMMIERVGEIAFRANFMSPRSFMSIDDWLELKPERRLVMLA